MRRCCSAFPGQGLIEHRERVALPAAASRRRWIIARVAYDEELADRVRAAADFEPDVVEKTDVRRARVPDRRPYRGRRLRQRRAADARRAARRPRSCCAQPHVEPFVMRGQGDARLGAGRARSGRGRRGAQALGRDRRRLRAVAAAEVTQSRKFMDISVREPRASPQTTDRCVSSTWPSRIVNARTTGSLAWPSRRSRTASRDRRRG